MLAKTLKGLAALLVASIISVSPLLLFMQFAWNGNGSLILLLPTIPLFLGAFALDYVSPVVERSWRWGVVAYMAVVAAPMLVVFGIPGIVDGEREVLLYGFGPAVAAVLWAVRAWRTAYNSTAGERLG